MNRKNALKEMASNPKDDDKMITQQQVSFFTHDMEKFDLAISRQKIRELFQQWQVDGDTVAQS